MPMSCVDWETVLSRDMVACTSEQFGDGGGELCAGVGGELPGCPVGHWPLAIGHCIPEDGPPIS
jgi:hypothetical protein